MSDNKIKTPMIIITGAEKYLGTIEDNTVTGITGEDTNFKKYITAHAMGQLESTIVGDKGNITMKPLTPEQELDFDHTVALWNLAQKKSDAWVNVQVFNSLLEPGKR